MRGCLDWDAAIRANSAPWHRNGRCRFHGAADSRYSGLSNREMQIFLLIGAGRSTGEIAAELGLSPKTVGAHREHIKTKLGLATAAELEREALLHVERME